MLKIAVVDDEGRIRRGITVLIEQVQKGYQVIGCYADGQEACEALREQEVDVVITDVRMPRMNGFQLIESLRMEKPALRFVILSGFDEFEYARTALRYGVSDYLLKPIDSDEMYRVLDQIAGEKRADQSTGADTEYDNEKRVIHTIKEIIKYEYKDELNLGDLSKKVFFNPTYVSKLFKQETGKTITDYLIEVRISKAKELLETRLDCKVYEVGEQVGYPEPVYFNRVFKKIVGVTPKEYQDHYGRKRPQLKSINTN